MLRPMRIHPLSAILFALGALHCGQDDGGTKPDPIGPARCGRWVVLGTDFSSAGSLSEVIADSSYTVRRDLAAVHSDAVIRVYGSEVYVVNRLLGDNIQIFDLSDRSGAYRAVRQIALGPGSNPHDVARIAADRAYVALNGATDLIEIDPTTGEERERVSLASLADADGIPDMDRLLYRHPYLYVSVQRIDLGGGTYQPVPPSYVAVVDTRTNEPVDVDATADGVQGIALAGTNPIAPMVLDRAGARILVPEAGVYGLLDAGIEAIDLDTHRSVGFIVTEEELGGDLIDFVLVSERRGYATVSDPAFVTSLVAFDPGGMEDPRVVYRSDGYELADLALSPCGTLIVCDRDYAAPGLRLFDAESGLAVAGVAQPLPTGLPPFEVVVLDR